MCVSGRESEIKSVRGGCEREKREGESFYKTGEVRESEAIRRLKERLRI